MKNFKDSFKIILILFLSRVNFFQAVSSVWNTTRAETLYVREKLIWSVIVMMSLFKLIDWTICWLGFAFNVDWIVVSIMSITNHIEWLIDQPWNQYTNETIDRSFMLFTRWYTITFFSTYWKYSRYCRVLALWFCPHFQRHLGLQGVLLCLVLEGILCWFSVGLQVCSLSHS